MTNSNEPYDLEDFVLTASNRCQYAKRFAVHYLLASWLTVSEMKTMDVDQLAARQYAIFEERVDADSHLDREFRNDIMKAAYKCWDELSPEQNALFPEDMGKAWRRCTEYRRTIRKWNPHAPKESDVPSGVSDARTWRHEELLNRLYEQQKGSPERATRGRHWPGMAGICETGADGRNQAK